MTPVPRPPASARDQQQRLRVALQLERAAARHERDHLDAVAEPERLRELAVGGAEAADEPDDDVLEPRLGERAQERLRVALPEERARVRDPEALAGRVRHPVEVVEVAAVRDRHDASRRRQRAHLLGDRVERRDDRVGVPRDDAADGAHGLPLQRTAAVSERRSWCASSESRRSAIQRTPSARRTAAPTRCTEPGGDVVITTSMLSARAIRSAAGIAVRFHVAASSGTTSRRGSSRACVSDALEPGLAVQLLRRQAPARPEVAHAVHPRLRRRQQLVVHVHPPRIVRCEDVRLDPERGQVRRELQRTLHAAAARRREVERHEENLVTDQSL